MARIRIFTGCLGIILLLAASGLAQEKKDNQSAGKATGEKPAVQSSAGDPYAVPEGTPEELKDFILKIMRNLPQNDESLKKARAAIIKAADKILAGKPNEEELNFAVTVKTHTMDKAEEIVAFSEELKKAGHEKQARSAMDYTFENDLRNATKSGNVEELKKKIAATLDYFKKTPPQSADLGLAIMIGQIAELAGDNAYAQDVYRALGKVFVESKETDLADFGKRLEGAARRLALVGHKMQLEGKLISGEAFDFSKYEGKVVLVEFWVSWRRACRMELAKLRKLYGQYHDKGFEIIGFGCDYRREDAEDFVRENPMPWPTVYGDKAPSPTFEYYGIMTFPMGILIGKDGNVIKLNVNADDLEKELEKLLGPAK